MAKFDCNGCGKCCISFGEFIRIERQVTERDYFCRFDITDEVFPVHVQPEFADEIDEEFENSDGGKAEDNHKGCIFMRKNPAGKGFACAIYPTRPEICREFKCYRMLIHHHPTGETRGKVIGINELKTQDGILESIWKEKIAHMPHPINDHHVPTGQVHAHGGPVTHGHDSHIHAHLHDLAHHDDPEWESAVITVLAAHGYHGEPVE
jgi:uncharacterized protein